MISPLALALLLFVCWIRGAGAQAAPDCPAQFDPLKNSLGQGPCVVLSTLLGECSDASFTVSPLSKGDNGYPGPTSTNSSAFRFNKCLCSMPVYNLNEACQDCQGVATGSFAFFTSSCSIEFTGSENTPTLNFPEDVPSSTELPPWSLIDNRQTNWTEAEAFSNASAVAAQAASASSSSSIVVTSSSSAGSGSTGAPGSIVTQGSAPTPAAAAALAGSSSGGSSGGGGANNTGVIVGGVLGGLAVLALLFIGAVFLLREWRRQKLRVALMSGTASLASEPDADVRSFEDMAEKAQAPAGAPPGGGQERSSTPGAKTMGRVSPFQGAGAAGQGPGGETAREGPSRANSAGSELDELPTLAITRKPTLPEIQNDPLDLSRPDSYPAFKPLGQDKG